MNITSTQKILGIIAVFSLIFSLSPVGVQAESDNFSITRNTCDANNDGIEDDPVVEVDLPSNTSSYELENTTTETVVDNGSTNANMMTFSDLTDGDYTLTVEKDDGNFESVTFLVDCDSSDSNPDPDISLRDNRCVSNDGVVEIDTPNGLDSYTLTNIDSGDTVVNDTDGASAGYITISDLADANYRFEGELNGDFATISFTVDCDAGGDDGDNGGGSGGSGDLLEPRDDGSVRGDRDENFGVSCTPKETLYLIGEQVLFSADVDGDINNTDVDFGWSGNNRITEDGNRSFVQYVTAGIKEVQVTADYRGNTETDTCYVQIHGGDGVSLDEVPYTGPADTAKTIGFILGILLLALGGGYLFIKRREGDGIPVGIPADHN